MAEYDLEIQSATDPEVNRNEIKVSVSACHLSLCDIREGSGGSKGHPAHSKRATPGAADCDLPVAAIPRVKGPRASHAHQRCKVDRRGAAYPRALIERRYLPRLAKGVGKLATPVRRPGLRSVGKGMQVAPASV